MATTVVYHPLLPANDSLSMAPLQPPGPRSTEPIPPKASLPQPTKDGKILRGRRERPCDACRRRKSKCVVTTDSETKRCAACGAHGQECTYLEDPQPRKRKVEAGGKDPVPVKRRYGLTSKRRTERRNRLTERFMTRSTASEHQAEISEAQTPSIKREHSSAQAAAGNGGYSKPQDEWSSTASKAFGTHIGYTTELEPILFDISQMSEALPDRTSFHRADGRNAFLRNRTDDRFPPDLLPPSFQDVDDLVHPLGPSLVRAYRDHIQCCFPVVDGYFFETYETQQWSALDPILLAAIYSITASTGGSLRSAVASRVNVKKLDELAFHMLSASLARPTLATIQAGLLLMHKPTVDSKALNAQLASAAYDLGLHLDCSHWALSAKERSLRKRLAWALCMQDKWCSLIHGRPSLVSPDHWAVGELDPEDFPTDAMDHQGTPPSEEAKRGWEVFIQMVSLTKVLSTVLHTFYTLKATSQVDEAPQAATRCVLEKAKPVQIQLKEWFANLPSYLKIDHNMTNQVPSTGEC